MTGEGQVSRDWVGFSVLVSPDSISIYDIASIAGEKRAKYDYGIRNMYGEPDSHIFIRAYPE